jgi:hypothetical protein
VPDCGIGLNVLCQKRGALLRIEIDDVDAEGTKPVDAALEIAAFANDDGAEAKLAKQAAAIPARGEGGDHNEFAVTFLASGVTEGVCFAMEGWVAVLHAAIVTRADQLAIGIENGGADGDAALVQALPGFAERAGKHGFVAGSR